MESQKVLKNNEVEIWSHQLGKSKYILFVANTPLQ